MKGFIFNIPLSQWYSQVKGLFPLKEGVNVGCLSNDDIMNLIDRIVLRFRFNRVRLLWLYLVFTGIQATLKGQEQTYSIYNYTSREIGLNMIIFEINQDKNGNLWLNDYTNIGTYNGSTFTNHSANFYNVIGDNNNFYDVITDQERNIWIGLDNGICLNKCGEFKVFKITDTNNVPLSPIFAISEDKDGNLLLGTINGEIYRWKKYTSKAKLVMVDTALGFVKAIFENDDGSVWISAQKGIFYFKNHHLTLLQRFKELPYGDIYADNIHNKIKKLENGLIVCNDNLSNLMFFNSKGGLVQKYDFEENNSLNNVNDFMELGSNIMIATNRGLYILDQESNRITKKRNDFLIKNQFYDVYLLSLIKTENNVIWFGSTNSLTKLNYLNEYFINYFFVDASLTRLVQEIPQFSSKWLVVAESGNIYLYDPVHLTIKTLKSIHSFVNYASVSDDNKELYLVTNDGVIILDLIAKDLRFKKKIVLDFKNARGLKRLGSNITALMGDFFIQVNTVSEKITSIKLNKTFNDSYQVDEHTIYFIGNGIEKYEHGRLKPIIKEGEVQLNGCLLSDRKLLYCTGNRYILVLNIENNTYKKLGKNIGLPNEGLNYMTDDLDGNIWLCSKSGLCRFDKQKEHCDCFSDQMGLSDNIYLFGLSTVKKGIIAGHRWEYFSYFDPKDLSKMFEGRTISILECQVNQKDVLADVNANKRIDVKSEKSNIFIKVNFPVFLSELYYNFEYGIASGSDTVWQNVPKENSIIINQLNPGYQNIVLRASNNFPPFNKLYKVIAFYSDKPFYTKLWFYFAIILLTILISRMIFKYQEKQRMALQKIRNNIARDLHDEIGSNLSHIKLLGEISLNKSGNTSSNLKKMVDKTIEVMNSMSDIIWSINPSNDSFPKVVDRIKQTCIESLEPLGIKLKFEIDPSIAIYKTNPSINQEYLMIFKEVINNIAKYSKAVNVIFYIKKLDGESFVSAIEDDGIGFDYSTLKRINGLHNIHSRAEKIKGKANIISNIGKGTTVEIILKYQ